MPGLRSGSRVWFGTAASPSAIFPLEPHRRIDAREGGLDIRQPANNALSRVMTEARPLALAGISAAVKSPLPISSVERPIDLLRRGL